MTKESLLDDWDEGFNAGWDAGFREGQVMAAFDLGVQVGQGDIDLPGKEPARSTAEQKRSSC